MSFNARTLKNNKEILLVVFISDIDAAPPPLALILS